jgi:SSS family solute:Na+ symporter
MMASSGNFTNDILEKYFFPNLSMKKSVRLSMLVTLIIGVTAVILAAQFTMVLDAILYAYAFMVSGLFIPTLGAYFWKKGTAQGALAGMIGGGSLTLLMMLNIIRVPAFMQGTGLDFSVYGIIVSAILFSIVSLLTHNTNSEPD